MNQDIIAANLDIVEAHFHSESLNEIEEALKLYTDDIVWEAPNRKLVFKGKQAVANNYRRMFGSMKDVEFNTVQRFATEDRVVDDSVVTFELIGDGMEGVTIPIGSKVEMRLVHIFEMRDKKISKEIAFEMMRAV
jgi:ketosteroid isomerase-like protein